MIRSGTRGSTLVALFGALALLLSDGVFAPRAWGQFQGVSRPSPEARDRLYEELWTDVTAIERHGNVLKRVVQLVKPTVVHIDARKVESTGAGRSRRVEETGSGVVITLDERFYVLTNRHVVKDAPNGDIKIILDDGRILNPTRVWDDRDTDVAVMAISATDLIPARLGDSSRVEIGDFVLALGSPFGLSHSVTYGIISAKGRRNLELGGPGVRYQNFFQTDAAINPGNSGGPLVSLRGEVIGINTAIASNSGGNEGIGFSIPIKAAMNVARQLIENGVVARGFLGVHMDPNFTAADAFGLGLPSRMGTRVTGAVDNSPAARAGLRAGDVIVYFDGVLVEDDEHLSNITGLTIAGKEVEVVVYRDGKPVTLTLTLATRPAN
ncbi:MAG: trypsin-like peptidase domain-containing protein [Planctomycetes bacterium]|nr:trypsin-like peptidase domain-containing protein [Planctomycetota bacterium]